MKTAKDGMADNKGIATWRNRLHPLLRWKQRLDDAKEEIDLAFVNYPVLKDQVVASPMDIEREVYKKVRSAADAVFNQLDANARITDSKPPEVDTGSFTEAENSAFDRKDEIVEQARQVDDMVSQLQDLREEVSEMISRLGE